MECRGVIVRFIVKCIASKKIPFSSIAVVVYLVFY